MRIVRYIRLCLLLWVFCVSAPALAKVISIEVNANSDDVEAKVDTYSQVNWAVLNLGGGILYSEDDYTIGNVHFSLKDQIFVSGLSLGLGFKGIAGRIEIDDHDYDAGAVGFVLLGDFDFRERYFNLPLVIYSDFTWAPDPLGFGSTDQYTEWTLGLRLYLVKNAAVLAGFRHLYLRFDEDGDHQKMSDDAVFVGLEINF